MSAGTRRARAPPPRHRAALPPDHCVLLGACAEAAVLRAGGVAPADSAEQREPLRGRRLVGPQPRCVPCKPGQSASSEGHSLMVATAQHSTLRKHASITSRGQRRPVACMWSAGPRCCCLRRGRARSARREHARWAQDGPHQVSVRLRGQAWLRGCSAPGGSAICLDTRVCARWWPARFPQVLAHSGRRPVGQGARAAGAGRARTGAAAAAGPAAHGRPQQQDQVAIQAQGLN